MIVYDDSITHAYRLAYKVNIYATIPLVDNNIYVDALSGNIIGRENLIMDANTPGTANTLYSGNQNITMDSYSSGYRLRETRTGANNTSAQIQTFDMQNGGNYSAAVDFSNSGTSWGTSNAGLDAHWGTEKVYDYWSNVRGRNSYDGGGSALKGYVHANLVALGYSDNDNAFWSRTLEIMTYGDGTTLFNPVVSLDVVAHEIGHGVCQHTVDLNAGNTTQYNEPSALNEGLSDIWGAVIENWATTNKQTWLIGEDIMKNGQPCLRSLINPKSRSYPDTYHGTNWNYSNEPHYNSAVLSHWFYLLSEGGNGTNDLGNTYNVGGIGITDAASIVWNAESNSHLQPQSQYADARTAMIAASTELFGANSCQTISVTNAWYAVGVGAAYAGNGGLSISGPSAFCTSATYSIANLPTGATVTWSASPGGIVNLTANGNDVSLDMVGSGNITLSASISNACGLTLTKDIAVGTNSGNTYAISLVSGDFCSSVYTIANLPTGSTIAWSVTGPYAVSGSSTGTSVTIVPDGSGNGTLTAVATTPCGNVTLLQELLGTTFEVVPPAGYDKDQCFVGTATVSTPGGSYTWEVTGDLSINGSGQTLTTAANSVQIYGTSGTISVTVTSTCSGTVNTLNFFSNYNLFSGATIEYGVDIPLVPTDPLIAYIAGFPYGEYVTGYKWYINNVLTPYAESNLYNSIGSGASGQCGNNTIRVEANFGCGLSAVIAESTFDKLCNFWYSAYAIYPNPAVDMLTVAPDATASAADQAKALSTVYEVLLYDKNGQLMTRATSHNGKVSIDSKKYPAGNYFLTLQKTGDKDVLKKQIVIKH